ncbi:MAG: tetratricopeptide repeat protein [Planctomycetota bacterium]|jgi:tetratricopeptide (TPR) repeat protein
MPEEETSEALAKAGVFFDKAEQAARAGDFDSAIELYIEGLRRAPNAVREGHKPLRQWAGRRQVKGGEKPSVAQIEQHRSGETALEQMLGAEYLLAKDPGHLSYGRAMLKAAVAGGYTGAAKWIADLMFLANNHAKKPSAHLYILLKEGYSAIGQLEYAVAACQRAAKLRPGDTKLGEDLRDLSQKLSAAKVRVDQAEDVFDFDEGEDLEALDVGDGTVASVVEQNAADQERIDPAITKALACFAKARKLAGSDNFDYAIDLYLEGLRSTPDAVQDGHVPLCELGFARKKKGGKKPTMMEKVKRMRGKTALDQMLNAEYLFVKDPDHLPHAEEMLKAAVASGYKEAANWVANYVFQTNNAAKKPSVKTYLLLRDSYKRLGQFDKALAACQQAARLKPQDSGLADDLKNLTAEVTMARGKYDQEGDFRKSIKDREDQERLHARDRIVQSEDYRVLAVKDARKIFDENPGLPRNIFNLAKVLSELESDDGDDEAIKLLEGAYESKKDFSYAQRAGEIRIRQIGRRLRNAEAGLERKSGDAEAKSKVAELTRQLNDTELKHWRLCVENYPTDVQAKYEYGSRLIRNKQYDDAIPLFQEAQRDPRHKISAMDKIGLCFFMKGWYADAVDVFKQAIDSYEIKDDGIAKELRYNLARSYEEQGDGPKALDIYRRIAQLDFGFRDVRQRVDKLRKQASGPS